ncbi:MAG: hypothetical protein AAF433_13320, partial [Bacteroidota bacterium]
MSSKLTAQCDIYPISISAYSCNDNGTPLDPSDDTFTIDVVMGGTFPGPDFEYFGSGVGGNGLYGQLTTVGPFDLNNAPFSIGFRDLTNLNCTYILFVDPGANCSNASCAVTSRLDNYVCDDNGTADPFDDTFTVDLIVEGLGGVSGGWNAMGFFNGSGTYGVPQTFGPFSVVTGVTGVQVFDNVNPNCFDFATIFSPGSCSPTCSIDDVLITDITCFTNGTSTPDDDVFTFIATVNGTNVGSGWTANDPFSNFGNYGTPDLFGPFLISGGPYIITFTDNNDPSCTFTRVITPPLPCSTPACSINGSTNQPVCNDNGTPNDPSDDTFTFTATINGTDTGPGWSANDPNSTTGTYGALTTFGPYPISGGDLNITIADASDPDCTTLLSVVAPAPCSVPLCNITLNIGAPICNDNGTPNDPSDDTFTFSAAVSGTNTGPSWIANDPNSTAGGFGSTVTFGPYPISGGSLNITVSDLNDPACFSTFTVLAPAPCSIPTCSISSSVGSPVCDDNGTPNNPSDDTFTFTTTINGTGTGPGWTADDLNNTTGTYGTPTTFGPYPISDGDLNITITDGSDAGCTTTFSVTAPAACSVPVCDIIANVGQPTCNDNGTPNDTSDDTFSFSLFVSGSNTGPFWTANDPNASLGAYGSSITLGPYPISNGDLNITITDGNNAGCTTTFSVTAPATCSVPVCDISANVSQPTCNDNGTPNDPTDDTFSFSATISGNNTGTDWSGDDPNATNGSYDTPIIFGPYPISNGDLNITITDGSDAGCTTTFSVTAPATCSVPVCDISANVGQPTCNDNGTPNDPSDDTFSFSATISGNNTGTSWSADDPNATIGSYDTPTTFGPYPISNGDLNITITDGSDAGCTTTFSVTAPAACSVPVCDISANVSQPTCNDNGTPNDPTDDTFSFSATISGNNTGAGWAANDPIATNGSYDTPTTFGPYPISSGDLNITITDGSDAGCTTTFSVTAPCSVPVCDISANVSQPTCNDNGTPNDTSDDAFSFSLFVSGSNTGPFWTANDPNASLGAYGSSITLGPYPISNGDLNITITDGSDAGCTTSFSVIAPAPCSVPVCDVSANVGQPTCNDNGTPNDPNDDTFSFSATISGNNTGNSWSADDPNATTGSYGTPTTFGPYPISSGDLNITITDGSDAGCTTTFSVTAPITCSVPVCDISANVGQPTCNDNGTPNDPTDDTFSFSATISGNNTGTSWSADDPNATNGSYDTPIIFGPYPISGGDLNITI